MQMKLLKEIKDAIAHHIEEYLEGCEPLYESVEVGNTTCKIASEYKQQDIAYAKQSIVDDLDNFKQDYGLYSENDDFVSNEIIINVLNNS